jgi:hypothetical protein
MDRNVADRASAVLELEDDRQGGSSSLGASTTQQQQQFHSINSSHQKNASKMPASAEAYQVCDFNYKKNPAVGILDSHQSDYDYNYQYCIIRELTSLWSCDIIILLK